MNGSNWQKSWKMLSLNSIIFAVLLCITLQLQCIAQEYDYTPVDSVFSDDIRTVQLHPSESNTANKSSRPATVPIGHQNLVLEFDVLGDEAPFFQAKVYHFKHDWQISDLAGIEYLDEYNDFDITNFELSFDTKTPYQHYIFQLPATLVSGNFLVVIYDETGTKPVLSRRFHVYENIVGITPSGRAGMSGRIAEGRQPFSFNINYNDVPLNINRQNIHVAIRQNTRNDHLKKDLQPTYIRQNESIMEFQLINLDDMFYGGNEFRKADIRSIQFNGHGVAAVKDKMTPVVIHLEQNKPRNSSVYQYMQDINGQYVIDHYEHHNGKVNSDYFRTYFYLKMPEDPENNYYVYGALTDWKLKDEFRMTYDDDKGYYFTSPLIKQGYYNYQFAIDKNGVADTTPVEGSFHETENVYEVFVYYQELGQPTSRLIGYKSISFQGN